MATSDSFNTSSVGNFYFTFSWRRTGYSSTANEHYIYYELIAHNTPGNYRTVYLKNLYVDGSQVFYNSGSSSSGKKYYDGDVVTSGNITVKSSNSSGDGTLSASFEAGVGSYPGSNCSGSDSWSLDRIPRYANFTEHYVSSTGLKSISVRWNADAGCDAVQYNLNDTGWVNTSGLDYTIWGLDANTSYNIRTRIRRQDSQLWTESGYIYATTKDIARITSAADINDEQKPSMTYTNPSGEYFRPYIEVIVNGAITDSIIKSAINSTSGTYTFELTQAEKNLLYQRSANYPSIVIRYSVETLYNNVGTYWHWADRTFTIINANPTFTDFATEEVNEKVLNLTGNANKHIRKYSALKIIISSANKMITKKGANPDKYRVIVGQQSKDIAYSEADTYQIIDNMDANTVQVFAVDSRNKETLKEKSLDIINYKELALNNIEFNRKNGVEETVIITGNGTWTNVNFGAVVNSIKSFVFRKKNKKETAWSDWYSIKELFHINEDGKFNNKVENEFTATTFDFGEEYDVEVKIEDELSTVVRPASVNSGKILMSALKEHGVCFGGVYDKNLGGALQVKGKNLEELAAGVTGDTLPIGSVMEWFVETIPVNWLRLDGSAVSRTDYKELFALYGTYYGEGDGSTTFNLPDMRKRVPVGKDSSDSDFNTLGKTGGEKTHTLTVDEMPSHNHNVKYNTESGFATASVLGTDRTASDIEGSSSGGDWYVWTTGAGGDEAHNNLQPYIVTNFIVKAKQSAGVVATVVDSLESDSTTDALSAKQGKELNKKISGIIESGSNSNGNYVKWSDGTMICYMNKLYSNINITNTWGSVYETDPINLGNFPANFVNIPTVTASCTGYSTVFIEALNPSKTSLGASWFSRPSPMENTLTTISFIAIGKWK